MSPTDSMEETRRLHLVSWNVAGWRTTLDEVTRTTKAGKGRSAEAERQACLGAWLDRLEADVLCLQETKLKRRDVEADARSLCATFDDGRWETFWSCNDGASGQRAGLNGVATFVKRGSFPVLAADRRPLGDPELDDEGRCLVTFHGSFALFNVYVPNGSGGARLSYKMRWLRALRAAMADVRARGTPVVLAGDLNARHLPKDGHWTFRGVDGGALSSAAASESLDDAARAAFQKAADAWPAVRGALRDRDVAAVTTENPTNGEKHSKFRCRAKHVATRSPVQLSPYEASPDAARANYETEGYGVDADGTVVDLADALFPCRLPGVLDADRFLEAFEKLASVQIPKAALRAALDLGLLATAPPEPTRAGDLPRSATSWLRGLVDVDAMVDSLDAVHPDRADRFTCWHQYTNKRYDNVGSRIDYVLVDAALFSSSKPVAGALDRGLDEPPEAGGPDSPAAAHRAAVLDGHWAPAGFDGSGLRDGRATDYLHHSTAPPHTGVRYTPPSWSDHVAVTLCLGAVPVPAPRAASTKRQLGDTQPHAKVRTITQFFSAAKPGANGAPAPKPKPKPPAPPKRKPPTISDFFAKKKSKP